MTWSAMKEAVSNGISITQHQQGDYSDNGLQIDEEIALIKEDLEKLEAKQITLDDYAEVSIKLLEDISREGKYSLIQELLDIHAYEPFYKGATTFDSEEHKPCIKVMSKLADISIDLQNVAPHIFQEIKEPLLAALEFLITVSPREHGINTPVLDLATHSLQELQDAGLVSKITKPVYNDKHVSPALTQYRECATSAIKSKRLYQI